jgi:hypothetical protein
LRLNPQNPRLHSRKQVRQIANSIKSFGFNAPVLIDAEQSVIAGHGRVLAAKELGWTEVPVSAIEHLDAAQRRAFAIADNPEPRTRFKCRTTVKFWCLIFSGPIRRSKSSSGAAAEEDFCCP